MLATAASIAAGGFCYFDNVQAELVEPVGSCSPKDEQLRETGLRLLRRRPYSVVLCGSAFCSN